MSLSNEERLENIFFSINRLSFLKEKLKKSGTNSDLYDLLDNLWPEVLNGQSNAIHWLFGSSSDKMITTESPNTPWEIAVVNHLGATRGDTRTENQTFDALKFTSISYLLSQTNQEFSSIFDIYQEIENLIYSLHRYNDDFLASLNGLSDLVSKISGICFASFAEHDEYAKAYLIKQIMAILYGPYYPYQTDKFDKITQFLVSDNTHHEFTKMMQWTLKEISSHHIRLVKANVVTLKSNKQDKLEKVRLQELILICEKIAKKVESFSYNKICKQFGIQTKQTIKRQNIKESYGDFLNCYGAYEGYNLLS